MTHKHTYSIPSADDQNDARCIECGQLQPTTHTAKHTPGPWVIRYKDAVYAQCGRFIADCELTPYDARPQPPNSTDAANAHLIAAAPAMYEALKELVCLPGFEPGEPYGARVLAALAQAEGKQ